MELEDKKITFVDIWIFINMISVLIGMIIGILDSVLIYIMFSLLILIELIYLFMRVYLNVKRYRIDKKNEIIEDMEKYNL